MRPGADSWALDCVWDDPSLPPLIGPFESLSEAEDWARLNVVGGKATLRLVSWPYATPALVIA